MIQVLTIVNVLLEEGRLIEYASRDLTPSQWNWVQIKKEAFSVLYGLDRFNQYSYGRPVKEMNNHKPLSIAPKRLQDIMLHYHSRTSTSYSSKAPTYLLLAR